MPRWKTPRWTLGAPALVALAVAGCGAAASQPKLHKTSEKRLLSLVAHARADAANHNGAAVHADLGEFVVEVKTLTTSGQLSRTTAGRLDRVARATAAQAALRLHQKPASDATTAATAATATTATTVTQPADPMTTTAGHSVPPAQNTAAPPAKQKPAKPKPAKQKPAKQNHQGDGGGAYGPTWPNPGHGDGNGHGGRPSGQSGAYDTSSIAKAWADWWKRVAGSSGD